MGPFVSLCDRATVVNVLPGHAAPRTTCCPTTLDSPHHVLLQAAARLNADGHVDLAADVHQLAKRWTPAEYTETIGNSDQHQVVLPPLQQQQPFDTTHQCQNLPTMN